METSDKILKSAGREIVEIGSRKYLIESEPIGNHPEIKEPILVVWGNHVLQLDYTWCSGWEGTPENKTYTNAKVSELNGSNWFHTSTLELNRVIETSSEKLQRRFNLNPCGGSAF